MPDAIVIVNTSGQIVLTTRLAEALFGYAPGERRGKLVDELLPARFRNEHAGLRRTYVKYPKNRTMGAGLELHGLRKDGREFEVEVSLSPLKTGNEALVLTAVRDITVASGSRRRFRTCPV